MASNYWMKASLGRKRSFAQADIQFEGGVQMFLLGTEAERSLQHCLEGQEGRLVEYWLMFSSLLQHYRGLVAAPSSLLISNELTILERFRKLPGTLSLNFLPAFQSENV